MPSSDQVIIYSTTWCAFCHTEAQWLDKLGVNYVKKDIEADKDAYDELIKKLGGNFQGVPVTDVSGDISTGFDRPKLEAAMKKHGIETKS